jgi:hypothetical protein
MGGQVLLMVRLFLYGENAPTIAATVEPKWQAWVQARAAQGDEARAVV